jgi:uracil phosphoribosyltransferase
MQTTQQLLITTLRNKNTSRATFRATTELLTQSLALQVLQRLRLQPITIETPLQETTGITLEQQPVLVPILRSGIAMLPPFLMYLNEARVGIVGVQRDEKTAKPHTYYSHLPSLTHDTPIIILDPMLATGGTLTATIALLLEHGAQEKNIIFVGIISAPPGVELIKKHYPHVPLIIAQHDPELNKDNFIEPGLGDFGDRFFGTD